MNKIILCQRLALKKKFVSELKKINPIINKINQLCKSESDTIFIKTSNDFFNDFTEYIQDKNIINLVQFFLNSFYRYNKPDSNIAKKITSKYFLSSYFFVGFPETALNMTKKTLEQQNESTVGAINYDIYNYSLNLHSSLNSLFKNISSENIRIFTKAINQYSNVLHIFLNEDKINKANLFSARWLEIDKIIDSIRKSTKYDTDQQKKILNDLYEEQMINEKLIKQMIPKFNITNLQIIRQLSSIYETTIHQCFWDMLEEDISFEKYGIVISTFNDVKNELLILAQYNDDLKKKINTVIDIDYIKQMLSNKCFDFQEIIKISSSCIDILKNLCAPVKTNDIHVKWSTILNEIYTNKISGFAEVGKHIFRFILTEIADIKNDILKHYMLQSI